MLFVIVWSGSRALQGKLASAVARTLKWSSTEWSLLNVEKLSSVIRWS